MSRRPASLRLRMVVGAVLWIGVALAASGWVLVDLFRAHVMAQTEAALVTDMEQLVAALAVGPEGALTVEAPLSDPRFRRPYSGLYWQVGEPGAPVERSRSLWDAALPVAPDVLRDGDVHVHRLVGPQGERLLTVERVVTLPDHPEPLRVAVAQDEAEPEAAVARFSRDLSIAFAVLATALMAAAAVQGLVVLQPLNRLRRRVLAVRRGRAEQISEAYPTEVQGLVDDLNVLLAHDRETVARARRQAGDLAHGLKTPLAVVAAEADALHAAGQPEAAAVLAEQVEAMRRHIEAHLARARAAASRDVPGARAELAPALEPLVRVLERLHGKAIAQRIPKELAFRGDVQDLQEMCGALLDNAGKWATTSVTVTAQAVGPSDLVVLIDDDGPGLPEAQREDVFQRGRRLDESMPGSGLGLGIVRDLAELYGGSVRLEASPAGGCRAVLRLPRAG